MTKVINWYTKIQREKQAQKPKLQLYKHTSKWLSLLYMHDSPYKKARRNVMQWEI